MSYSVSYTLTDLATQKVHDNTLLVDFENDQDDGRDFFVVVVKDRHEQQIFKRFGSDYEKVNGELNCFLGEYKGEIHLFCYNSNIRLLQY